MNIAEVAFCPYHKRFTVKQHSQSMGLTHFRHSPCPRCRRPGESYTEFQARLQDAKDPKSEKLTTGQLHAFRRWQRKGSAYETNP